MIRLAGYESTAVWRPQLRSGGAAEAVRYEAEPRNEVNKLPRSYRRQTVVLRRDDCLAGYESYRGLATAATKRRSRRGSALRGGAS